MSPERGPEGTPLGLAAPETVQGAARSQLRPPRAPRTVTLQAARQAPGARRSKQVPIHSDGFLHFDNHQRLHRGYRTKGRIPATFFMGAVVQ